MHDIKNIPLCSSEVFGIWNSYMNDSMAICFLKHFVNNVDDDVVRPIVQHALNLSTEHISELTKFFQQDGLPIPDGFSEDKDLNLNAPRLFTDGFYLVYLSFMARSGMDKYSLVLGYTARKDLRDYYTKCLNESADLYNKLTDIRLSKGLYIRSPYIEVGKSVQYIESKNFMIDWFGDKRPMIAREIFHIFARMITNIIGIAVTTAFGQVSKTDEVVEFMFRGRDIAKKRIVLFSTIFTKEGIPIPSTSESYVTDSIIAPFSEKLMMFHMLALTSIATSDIGTAISDTLRSDLESTYARLVTETLKYGASGANIMIKNRWLEQPPQVIDHENLVKV